MRLPVIIIFLSFFVIITSHSFSTENMKYNDNQFDGSYKQEVAVFGAGCFWCVEAVFSEIKGVIKVSPGYAGGHTQNPTYEQVCSGKTGHVEVCYIVFNPDIISFDKLLQVFWQTHDPTTLNRQGKDIGDQYRSVIFYTNEQQKIKAEEYKKRINDSSVWDSPVVTQIEELTNFFPAEDYHRNYYNENINQPYCRMVISPKLEKFKKVFGDIIDEQ